MMQEAKTLFDTGVERADAGKAPREKFLPLGYSSSSVSHSLTCYYGRCSMALGWGCATALLASVAVCS